MRIRILLSILVPMLILMGCRQTAEATAENVEVGVALDTDMPAVGDATLLVTVTTDDGTPVNDATVSVRGDMTHAGMVPVIPDPVSAAEEGVYSIPFEFTMGGDWIITVDVVLANGDTASVEYEIDAVGGEMDMDDMDMTSGVSGVYMSITNNGAEDATLISVSTDFAAMAQIHETTVDENDMASMQELEDGLIIPAGETVNLSPGGYHIMLMNLEEPLIDGETLTLTLEFADGTSIDLDIPIMGMMMDDGEPVESVDLSITAFWARPTSLGDHAMEMEGTEEAGMNMDMEEATEESE